MDLYLFVIGVGDRTLKSLVSFYQEQQAVHGRQGVQNHMDIGFSYIGGECILTASNNRKSYPKTLSQRGIWVRGLVGFLKNTLGEGKVVYNER